MKIDFTERAAKDFDKLSLNLKKQVSKQLSLLIENIRYPSLHAKKYDEIGGVWQGRVDQDYRFYFRIIGDTYRILTIVPHPK